MTKGTMHDMFENLGKSKKDNAQDRKEVKSGNKTKIKRVLAVGSIVGAGLYIYTLGIKHGYRGGYSRGNIEGFAEASKVLVESINDYVKVQVEKSIGGE